MTPESSAPPLKDASREQPVPTAWRPTIEQLVQRLVAGDYALAEDVEGVEQPSSTTSEQIRAYLKDYGATLVPLEPATWESSVVRWMDPHWKVLIDLWTAEEGCSDLVLHLTATERGAQVRFETYMVYVP